MTAIGESGHSYNVYKAESADSAFFSGKQQVNFSIIATNCRELAVLALHRMSYVAKNPINQ